ncbi:MAG: ATP-dependent Lon protease [Gammaproteobacteria bacterium]|jgi:ATP-dependent Lon protease|nr:ATP-dependent Lon protease [Gammaproteobacteria bacterium]
MSADEDVLIIVPVRSAVLFPGVVLPIAISDKLAIAGAQEAVRTQRRVGLLLQSDVTAEEAGPEGLHRVGTTASIVRFITAPDGTHHLICQGQERFTLLDFASREPFLVARIDAHREPTVFDQEIEARGMNLREKALEAVQLLPQAPGELTNAIRGVESIPALADMIASFMDLKLVDKQDILATFDLKTRLDRVLTLLNRRIEVLKVSRQIDEKTREAFDERQKEAVLRERLHQIQKELGDTDGSKSELADLKQAIKDAGMPEEALEQAQRELNRLERMPEQAAEYSMTRTYLEWLLAMPWSKVDPEQVDIEAARKILDEDHFGLAKIKRRILEFLAVRKLNPEGRSPILCFVGPPGVGKTSLGQSIAKAIGLKFGRVSLGGVHDEAEIRGHRRTYIGSLPGNIAQALRKASRRNPVLMLDEVDKLSASHQGDPFSALLEVLDPEQNNSFRDNYLGVPFDLSKVLFIATANVLDAIPGPLRDRMEIIELTGYTEEEKLQIARRYLLKRQLQANGLTDQQVQVSDEALRRVITDYTREAGVRGLERQIGGLLRHSAVTIASGNAQSVSLDAADVEKILGAARFESDVALRTSVPGVATGLAWTPAGGDILFVESSRVRGSGKLILTGQLGDVMKESAQAAVTLVKSLADRLGIDPAILDSSDLHIHVPAGAIPKDGPSAGVAISTSLASLLTQRTVRADVAMTGEISLRGVVMPVGGIKEKVVAASRAGIRTVILPARNRRDFDDIPESVRAKLEFVWAEKIEDVLARALEAPAPRTQTPTETPQLAAA